MSFLFQSSVDTCDTVSTELRHAPMLVFQNLMHPSSVPPPDASRLLLNGHHGSALTAAEWSSSLYNHCVRKPAEEDDMDASHRWRRLSLPPLASCCTEPDHLNPHTSFPCLRYVYTYSASTVPDPRVIVHNLTVHTTRGQDFAVPPCERIDPILVHTLQSPHQPVS